MAIHVGQVIGELLYEYDTITIPSFGAITMYYQAADVDVLQGKLNPPKKEVNFNSNIVINDGLLTDQIRVKFGVSFEAAQEAVEHFVQQIHTTLQRGDAFELVNIGKFYKQGQDIHFTANITNFNADAYGLPRVQFFPIAKANESKIQFNTLPSEENIVIPPPPPREWGWMLQWIIPTLAIVALGLTVYALRDSIFNKLIKREQANAIIPDLTEAAEDNDLRVNQKPVPTSTTGTETTEKLSEDETESETEQATPSPNQQEKVIIIGAFQNKENAEQLIKEIVKAGYNPISETRNGKRYVGIRYGYEEETTFNNAFADIKKRFNKDAWILNE